MCQNFVHTNLMSKLRSRNLESNFQFYIYQTICIYNIYLFSLQRKSLDSFLRGIRCKALWKIWSYTNGISIFIGFVEVDWMATWLVIFGESLTRVLRLDLVWMENLLQVSEAWFCTNETRSSLALLGVDRMVICLELLKLWLCFFFATMVLETWSCANKSWSPLT